MKLLPQEKPIEIPYGEGLQVTNFRVRYEKDNSTKSILIENIQFIGMRYKSQPLFLAVGIISGAICLFNLIEDENFFVVTGIATVVFVVLYFISRRHYFTISSAGGSIELLIRGYSTAKVTSLIDIIEEAVVQRKADLVQPNQMNHQ